MNSRCLKVFSAFMQLDTFAATLERRSESPGLDTEHHTMLDDLRINFRSITNPDGNDAEYILIHMQIRGLVVGILGQSNSFGQGMPSGQSRLVEVMAWTLLTFQ